jgi:CMP/dCMP kinase
MIVTIDGPVASGKSTVSRMLAQQLGYYYLCSGLLYRALGYLLINLYEYTLETIAHPTQEDIERCLDSAYFSYRYDDTHQERVFFKDQDITPYLKDKFIDKVASIMSVDAHVRHAVAQLQRSIASAHNIVTDGRDVGSAVFPHAEVKFFVTASVQVRAQRWRKDQEKYSNYLSEEQAIASITDRDDRDKNRTIAPLIIPDGAIIIDTSELTIQETIDEMLKYIKNY